MFTLSLAILPLLVPLATAHRGCGGHEIGQRNPGGRTIVARQGPTDEASAASSLDPNYECTGYSYAPVTNIKGSYPTIWQTADIVSGDSEAMSIFSTINNTLNTNFAGIGPHGTNNGDFAGVNYTSADPDCWWTWRQCTTPAASTGLQADITQVPEPLTWGLGFDDGPNCSHNALYDYLSSNQQKATMFYIGSNVFDWPLQAIRAIDDGHEVCVHTWSHQYMTSFSNQQAFAELYYTRKAIKDLLGVTPKCWRPPYGDVDNRIRAIAAGLNLTTIVWSDDTEDWKAGAPGDDVTPQDVTSNYQAIIDKVSNNTYVDHGPVVLNHELTNFTMSEFISQYPSIKSAFKHVVPLCTAMNWTHPYAETNYTCPSFDQYMAGTTNTSTGTTPDSSVTSSSTSGTATASGSATAASGSSGSQASGSSSASSSSSKDGGARGNMNMISGWMAVVVGGVVAGSLAVIA